MFAYLTEIIVFTFIGFAVVYPSFLWIAPRQQIDGGFYRFNLGMTCIVGSIGGLIFQLLDPPTLHTIYVVVWLGMMLAITAIYWRAEKISNLAISCTTLLGLLVLFRLCHILLPGTNPLGHWLIILLGSSIVAAVLFSMILGHWYLNVVQLPIALLKKATLVLWFLLAIRLLWVGASLILITYTDSYGIKRSLWQFLGQFDGFLLSAALFIGVFTPLILNALIWRTLRLQATQSATGLLYVSTVAILFGDLFFKYYLFQYGFVL